MKKNSLDLVSGQTSVRSNRPLIRLVCAWNCLWSDRSRPKWPLIRQVPDHCPDKSALEAFSRPGNSSAPRTCVSSKMVWSELNSVWPPRPGQHWNRVNRYYPVLFNWKWNKIRQFLLHRTQIECIITDHHVFIAGFQLHMLSFIRPVISPPVRQHVHS